MVYDLFYLISSLLSRYCKPCKINCWKLIMVVVFTFRNNESLFLSCNCIYDRLSYISLFFLYSIDNKFIKRYTKASVAKSTQKGLYKVTLNKKKNDSWWQPLSNDPPIGPNLQRYKSAQLQCFYRDQKCYNEEYLRF